MRVGRDVGGRTPSGRAGESAGTSAGGPAGGDAGESAGTSAGGPAGGPACPRPGPSGAGRDRCPPRRRLLAVVDRRRRLLDGRSRCVGAAGGSGSRMAPAEWRRGSPALPAPGCSPPRHRVPSRHRRGPVGRRHGRIGRGGTRHPAPSASEIPGAATVSTTPTDGSATAVRVDASGLGCPRSAHRPPRRREPARSTCGRPVDRHLDGSRSPRAVGGRDVDPDPIEQLRCHVLDVRRQASSGGRGARHRRRAERCRHRDHLGAPSERPPFGRLARHQRPEHRPHRRLAGEVVR